MTGMYVVGSRKRKTRKAGLKVQNHQKKPTRRSLRKGAAAWGSGYNRQSYKRVHVFTGGRVARDG